MKLIFIIGNIGSGKSTSCNYIADILGSDAQAINLDVLGHEVFEMPKIKEEIKKLYGKDCSRKEIADIVFNSKESLDALNTIIHPEIYNKLQNMIEDAKNRGVKYLVVEQTSVQKVNDKFLRLADYVICVSSNIIRNINPERIIMQLPKEKLENMSDFVIHNDGDFDYLKNKCEKIADIIKSGIFGSRNLVG